MLITFRSAWCKAVGAEVKYGCIEEFFFSGLKFKDFGFNEIGGIGLTLALIIISSQIYSTVTNKVPFKKLATKFSRQ